PLNPFTPWSLFCSFGPSGIPLAPSIFVYVIVSSSSTSTNLNILLQSLSNTVATTTVYTPS
ncbi:unnamed protein product, partial [Allacma fusca]